MKLTLFQTRLLIIWIGIHSAILFVNIAAIKGELPFQKTYTGNNYTNVLTSLTNKREFWPFITFSQNKERDDTTYNYQVRDHQTVTIYSDHYFNGVFNSYGYEEYIVYLISGFAVVYATKLWQSEK